MRMGALLPDEQNDRDRQYRKNELYPANRHYRLEIRTKGSFTDMGYWLARGCGEPKIVLDELGEYVLVFVEW